MSWNKVFNYFIEIKHTIGENFTFDIPFKKLTEQYGTEEQYERIKNLQLRQFNSLLLIRYGDYSDIYGGEVDSNTYWNIYNGFYRECRSLVIDLDVEELVLTPYAKFLNMNESELDSQENVLERISKANVVEFSNKLDGSMVSARYYKGDIIMSTSRELDRISSWRLDLAYSYLNNNIKDMLKAHSDLTFMFELISKQDAHVVKYSEKDYGLHLIGIRDSRTGNVSNYDNISFMANLNKVKCTKIEKITFDQMLEKIKTERSDEKEGWVLNIDGYRVKVKTDDYILLHKTLSHISSHNAIIKAISDGTFDDLLSKIPNGHKDRVRDIYDKVIRYVQILNSGTEHYYTITLFSNTEKKHFMINVDEKVPNRFKGYVRNKYLGKKNNYLQSPSGKYVTMKEIDEVLNEK